VVGEVAGLSVGSRLGRKGGRVAVDRWGRYLLFTVIGCAIWCTRLTLCGYSFGGTCNHVQMSFSSAAYVIPFPVILAVIHRFRHRFRTLREERS
jgi:membrane protein DedA with SNARE-associated domain